MSAQTPPGWYPDPSGRRGTRWWSGTMWTDDLGPLPSQIPRPQLPDDVPTNTPWIWLIAVLPVLGLLSGFVYAPSIHMVTIGPDHLRTVDPSSVYTPGYVLAQVIGVLFAAANIVVAWRDERVLARRGVVRPFPWPWAFLAGAVYVIGRFVIVRRVAPRASLTPLWVFVVLFAATLVLSGVRVAGLLQSMV